MKYFIIKINENETIYQNGRTFSLGDYRFLTVLTDGFINPNSNHQRDNIVGIIGDMYRDTLYIELSNGKKIYIDGEMKNIPIFYPETDCFGQKVQSKNEISNIRIFYRESRGWGNRTYEAFCNNLYVYLHREPYDFRTAKKLPQFTLAETSLPANTARTYLIGSRVQQASTAVLLHYIPELLKEFVISLDCDNQINCNFYGVNQQTGAEVDLLGGAQTGEVIFNIPASAQLIKIVFTNTDLNNAHNYAIEGFGSRFMLEGSI